MFEGKLDSASLFLVFSSVSPSSKVNIKAQVCTFSVYNKVFQCLDFFFLLAKLIFTSSGQANKRVGSKELVLHRLARGRCGFIVRHLKAKDSPFCPAQVRIALFTRLSHPHALSHWWQRDNCHEQELAVLVRQQGAFQTGPSPTDSSTPHSSTASKKRPIGCLGLGPCASTLGSHSAAL